MTKHTTSFHVDPAHVPRAQTLSVKEAAQLLGFEQTTVYRLIWCEELRLCAGTARFRIPQAEIERFLARTQTYDERVRSRPKTRKSTLRTKWRVQKSLVHPSHNPHMIFIPLASFSNRPIGGRLLKTIVPDDVTLAPKAFVEIDEAEWIGK